jgi:hypothetical protein
MKLVTIESLGRFVQFAVAGRRQRAAAAVVAAAVLGVAACATGPAAVSPQDTPAAREAAVTKRWQERWDALLRGDVKASYDYLSPASRAVTSLQRYQTRVNPANFQSVKLEKVSCEAEICRLRFWLTFDHRVMKGVQTPIEETWVFENGQPWYVYRE